MNSKNYKSKKRGEKKMTENAIRYKEAQERERSNKANEEREEKKRKFDVFKSLASEGGKLATGIVGALNDPSWYNLDKQMVKDVAQISFHTPLGGEIEIQGNKKTVFPGIMTIALAHTIGNQAAAETASKQIYSFIRSANSGSKNYEANDIMAYILTMCDAYSYHAYMCRLYSVLTDAKGYNRYYNNAMIKACGDSTLALRGDIAQFRAYINSYAQRLNAFYVPKDIPLLQRRYWVYSNIFKDAAIKKSQEYLFVPKFLGQYDDTNSTLVMKFLPDGSLTGLQDFITFGDNLINALLSSADIAIMSGDILKAYGEGNLFYLSSIDEKFHVESVYSQEVLSQIHNTTLIGSPASDNAKLARMYDVRCPAGGKIEQGFSRSSTGSDYSIYGAIINTGNSGSGAKLFANRVINMYKDDISPDELMVATRLMIASGDDIYASSGSATKFYINGTLIDTAIYSSYEVPCLGTEVAVEAVIYTINPSNQYVPKITAFSTSAIACYAKKAFANVNAGDWNGYSEALEKLQTVAKFDWAPQIFWFKADDSAYLNGMDTLCDNLDIANTACVSRATLQNMHYTAILSEYGIPLLGIKVRTR